MFVIYVAIQEQKKMPVHFKKQAQIKTQSGVQVRALLFDKALTKILAEYSNYSNIFLVKNIAEFLENTKINKYAIKLEEDKQSSFSLIYSLQLIELEILKTYIKINLANGFI